MCLAPYLCLELLLCFVLVLTLVAGLGDQIVELIELLSRDLEDPELRVIRWETVRVTSTALIDLLERLV